MFDLDKLKTEMEDKEIRIFYFYKKGDEILGAYDKSTDFDKIKRISLAVIDDMREKIK